MNIQLSKRRALFYCLLCLHIPITAVASDKQIHSSAEGVLVVVPEAEGLDIKMCLDDPANCYEMELGEDLSVFHSYSGKYEAELVWVTYSKDGKLKTVVQKFPEISNSWDKYALAIIVFLTSLFSQYIVGMYTDIINQRTLLREWRKNALLLVEKFDSSTEHIELDMKNILPDGVSKKILKKILTVCTSVEEISHDVTLHKTTTEEARKLMSDRVSDV